MPTRSTPKSTDQFSDLDREILVMERQSQLAMQKNSLLQAEIQIKKATRSVEKYRDTIDSLHTAIADTESQIADLLKGGEK